MSFKDQDFTRRFTAMGDQAELAFEMHNQYGSFERYGLLRPAVSMAAMPPFLRYTPDYVTKGRFVEVQGFGSDRTVKLKVEKLTALQWWNAMWGLDMWLLDSKLNRWGCAPLEVFQKAIDMGDTELKFFPEGKAFFAFKASKLPIEWTKIEVAT